MQSGEIESEFHYYVQPQENPYLSSFCRNFTGISQVSILGIFSQSELTLYISSGLHFVASALCIALLYMFKHLIFHL